MIQDGIVSNVYGDVQIGDQARAVVGNVHNHYYSQTDSGHDELRRAKQSFMHSLTYPETSYRDSDIPREHNGTFEGVFNDSVCHKWDSLSQWLSSDADIY